MAKRGRPSKKELVEKLIKKEIQEIKPMGWDKIVEPIVEPITKYFIKLINGEKIEITKSTFDVWLHDVAGSYIVVETGNSSKLYIKRDAILMGYTLDTTKPFDNTLNKK